MKKIMFLFIVFCLMGGFVLAQHDNHLQQKDPLPLMGKA